jgi:hypothetical protein
MTAVAWFEKTLSWPARIHSREHAELAEQKRPNCPLMIESLRFREPLVRGTVLVQRAIVDRKAQA